MSSIKIYHNPACGVAQTLGADPHSGAEPGGDFVIWKRRPAAERLIALLAEMGMAPRALLRKTSRLTPVETGRDSLER